LTEIDELGASAILNDLRTVNGAVPGSPMKPPELLTAMAREGQRFFQAGQVNPWITSFAGGSGHARH
jgi:hypothetical protein